MPTRVSETAGSGSRHPLGPLPPTECHKMFPEQAAQTSRFHRPASKNFKESTKSFPHFILPRMFKKKRTLPYHLFLLKKVILSPRKRETHKLRVKPHSCPPLLSVPQISPPSILISCPLPPPTPASLPFSESTRPSLPQSLYVRCSLSLLHLSLRSSRLTSSNHMSLN